MSVTAELQPILRIQVKSSRVKDSASTFASALRSRLKEVTYSESIEKAPELTLALENEDLFWIDKDGGADVFLEGGLIEFQFGYLCPDDPMRDFLSPIRVMMISGKPNITRDQFVVKAISELQTALGTVIEPIAYPPSKVSDIVHRVLGQNGFDSQHRVVQDTVHVEKGIISSTGETLQAFLYRLAAPYNYRLYQTTGPDKKAIIHFHKVGWTNQDAPLANQDGQLSSGSDGPGFGSRGDGKFARPTAVLTYRPSPENENDFLDFSIKYDVSGTPSTVRAVGVDENEGKIINEYVTEQDRPENALSARSEYADPSLQEPDDQVEVNHDFFPGFNASPGQANSVDITYSRENPTVRRSFAAVASKKSSAKDHGTALLGGSQEPVTLDIELVGRPDILAGDIIQVEGLKIFSQKYVVKNIKHTISGSSGFRSSLEAKSDGVNGDTAKPATNRELNLNNFDLTFDRKAGMKSLKILVRTDGTTTDVDPATLIRTSGDEGN